MITSPSNNRIKQLMQLKQKAKVRKEQGVFLTEGTKMFLEAPREWVREVYVSESFYIKCALKEELEKFSLEIVADEVFKKISDTVTPQGILCVIKQPQYSLASLLEKKNPLFVLLEDLQDPGNLGTIIRTGEGAGIDGVIMSKDTVDIYNPKTIRATMGSIYRVPFLYVEDLRTALKELKNRGVTTYAAHLRGETYYDKQSYTKGSAFLIGNEGNGLKEETAEAAENYIKIPMEGNVESLNAAIAATLFMYEAKRQRRENK